MIKSFKFAETNNYKKDTFPIKELCSHGGERHYGAPANNKPYCKFVKEDLKQIRKKVAAERNAAYVKKYSPNYILEPKERQPEFEMKNNILCFVK